MNKNQKIDVFSQIEPRVKLASLINTNGIINRVELSESQEILQTSIVLLKKGRLVEPHFHNSTKRTTIGTQEVWIVQKGKAIVKIFDLDNSVRSQYRIKKGTIVFLLRGGHSISKITNNLLLIEVKNGPYWGSEVDKTSITD